MCGIVAVIGSREAAPLLLDGLRKLEYRGYDSAGIATIESLEKVKKGSLTSRKAKGKLTNLSSLVDEEGSSGHIGIGHTRWATHGKPDEINAHPHMDQEGKVAVVQNGIIENYRLLKEELEAQGIKFASETDTEVIPHLISRELKELKSKGFDSNGLTLLTAVQNISTLLKGSYALAVIWVETPDSLVVASKEAPLVIGLGESEFLCASDTPALAGFARTILPMEDREVALLTPLGIELYNSEGIRQQRTPSLLTGVEHVVEKKHFRHFMLKEIYEQPEMADLWIARHFPKGFAEKAQVALPFDDSFYEPIEQIQIVACGSSRHAGMIGAYLLEQFAGIPTAVFYASEFRYAPSPLTPNTLVIGVTQSGETADTLAALTMEVNRREGQKDTAYQPRLLAITNRVDSSIARKVQHILDIGAGLEVGVAATKTFLAELLAFYGLTIAFASHKKSKTDIEIKNFIHEIQSVPHYLREVVQKHDQISEVLAHQFSGTKDVIYLGRGINYPIALEGALKLKETSYIHAEGYPAGEMKHGPIALLDPHVQVISIANPGIVFEKVLSNSQEAKARDAKLIGIAPESAELEIFDKILPIPEVSELISPLLTVIPMQLLSYHIAANRGLDVDQPRNLAKSVTVE